MKRTSYKMWVCSIALVSQDVPAATLAWMGRSDVSR
jgi:hypothetical protein